MTRHMILSIMIGLLLSKASFSSAILEQPKVDERVELISIVFRLAECDEYSSEKNIQYVNRINDHFLPFKTHPLIDYIKKIRSQGIGYDAVMQMAIHISGAPLFEPLVEFDRETPSIRWGKNTAAKFLKLLRAFYTDAHCSEFFSGEQEYYTTVVEAFLPNYERLDLNWYASFYGTAPKEKFVIIIAPGIGGNNYGPSITKADGDREIYAIMGAWDFDSTGNCNFTSGSYFSILLHEFNHSFINPLLHQYKNELAANCSALYAAVANEMQNQAYGDWEVMFNESVVRAAVVQYMIDHHYEEQIIVNERNNQFYRGFLWMDDLVEKLNYYSQHSNEYKSFKAYMPALVISFSEFRNRLPEYEALYNEHRPKITAIDEFENGSMVVDASIKTITVHFSTEMNNATHAINYGSMGKKHLPSIHKVQYAEDNRAVMLEVDLACNKAYQIMLLGNGFISQKRVPIKDYEISFKTTKCQ